MPDFRVIPSIEQLRQRAAVRAVEARFGHALVVDALRAEADALRARVSEGRAAPATVDEAAEEIERALDARIATLGAPSLRRVINATGVIIHTNLGRAPLPAAAAERIAAIATGYSNLEFDLDSGSRGARDIHAERLICRLTGAEAAVVVNNNAAATLLILAALAKGREVIVSRGELVEIGGGFRVPDVMAQSGAILREVGTTNRTRVSDYGAAVSDRTALMLRVHPSNFRIEGFTERPSLEELVALGRKLNVPVVEDLGSGYLGESALGASVHDEPAINTSVHAGAAVICFSGDKLLGGPQAGIIVGRRELMTSIRRHPLMRALRVDKVTYAALEATLEEYAAGRAVQSVPVARMISASIHEIRARADKLVASLRSAGFQADLIDGFSTIGGGSAPGSQIATKLVAVSVPAVSADALESQLRALETPVIARIEDGVVVLDLRTVLPQEDDLLVELLANLTSIHREAR